MNDVFENFLILKLSAYIKKLIVVFCFEKLLFLQKKNKRLKKLCIFFNKCLWNKIIFICLFFCYFSLLRLVNNWLWVYSSLHWSHSWFFIFCSSSIEQNTYFGFKFHDFLTLFSFYCLDFNLVSVLLMVCHQGFYYFLF